MSTVRVYRSTDPGAPAHPSATRGSMAALLRACLVTGYGSGENFKAPAGWEEPFAETNNKACFRALSGARAFYQIDDALTNANVTRLYGFESMSNAETGVGWGKANYFGKTPPAGTPRWTVIADEKTCYVLLGTTIYQQPYCFGEFFSYLDNDPYNSIVAGSSALANVILGSNAIALLSNINAGNTNYRTTTNESLGHVHKDIDGQSSAFSIATLGAASTVIGGSYHVHPLRSGTIAPIIPMFIADGNWVQTPGSTGYRQFHGHLRGMMFPCAFRPYSDEQVVTLGGVNYLSLNVTSYSASSEPHQSQFLFRLNSWEG